MKQHIDAHDWGTFERSNSQAAQIFRRWLDEKDYPPSDSGCVLYDVQPVFLRATIGRLIEFLDERFDGIRVDDRGFSVDLNNVKVQGGFLYSNGLNAITITSKELCDALWEAVKEVLEKNTK